MQYHHLEVKRARVLGFAYDPKSKLVITTTRHRREKLGEWEGQAGRRLHHLTRLIRFRFRHGICHPKPPDWLILVVNALVVRWGWATPVSVARYICPHDRDGITSAMVEDAIASARCFLIPNHKAGPLANLARDELLSIQDEDDIVLTMHPIDETPPERKERRDSRAREKGAARQRRYWKRQKSDDANLVNGRNASNKRIGIVTQDARIVAAIQNGATRKPEISAVTGLPDTTIGPLLTKLIKAGAIERVGHGLYRAPEVARASAQPTDHVAEGNVPESEAKGACATMPASLVLEEEEPLEPSGAWRKPRTPSPAEWARMQWAADGRVA